MFPLDILEPDIVTLSDRVPVNVTLEGIVPPDILEPDIVTFSDRVPLNVTLEGIVPPDILSPDIFPLKLDVSTVIPLGSIPDECKCDTSRCGIQFEFIRVSCLILVASILYIVILSSSLKDPFLILLAFKMDTDNFIVLLLSSILISLSVFDVITISLFIPFKEVTFVPTESFNSLNLEYIVNASHAFEV